MDSKTQKKKKVLLVITKSNFGGAQKYVHDLAVELVKNNYEVKVALGGHGILKSKLETESIPVIEIPNLERDISVFKEFSVLFYLINLFKKEKPDIVHLNSSKIGGLGSLAGRITGVRKIIFTAHGWAFNENRNFISKILIRLSYWTTILLSHKTIAVSNKMREQVSNWPFVQKKVAVIHNGIKNFELLDRNTARNKLIQDSSLADKKWVGTIAELHTIKGHKYLIEAASELPELQFVFLGGGEEKEKLEKQVTELKLKNVHILGFIDNASQYLKAFDYFVLPSLSEGLAIVILEAGMAKLPVIASNAGGIPEIINDNESGLLIEPKEPNQIVEKINYLEENPEQAEKLGENLYKKVSEQFSFKKMLENTIALYR